MIEKLHILNMSDDPLDLEEDFDEIKEVTQFTREEGHIYESIEDELDSELEVTGLADIDDLLNDHLGIDSN